MNTIKLLKIIDKIFAGAMVLTIGCTALLLQGGPFEINFVNLALALFIGFVVCALILLIFTAINVARSYFNREHDNRATSFFKAIEEGYDISITWTLAVFILILFFYKTPKFEFVNNSQIGDDNKIYVELISGFDGVPLEVLVVVDKWGKPVASFEGHLKPTNYYKLLNTSKK